MGPMADTTPPTFRDYNRTPNHPGPTTIVNVSTAISDEDSNPTVKLQYGYDNATWTTKNATKGGLSDTTETFTDRNPASGYTQSRIQKTYTPDREIIYLHVYTYSEDDDTCYLRVRGYINATSTWETIYYAYEFDQGTGTYVDTHFINKGYTRWDIDFYDDEGNDDLYYNCTYKVGDNVYTADIPAAGTQSKVYYRFNATDSATNWALSDTLNYTIDTIPPQINDFTKPASTVRLSGSIPIYSNVSDPTGVTSAYINWSVNDYSTWSHVTMSKISGSYTNAKFMGGVYAPATNTTVWIRIGAYDEGSNHNNTT
ncbi:MAG: hypothetical protein KAQ96_12205, partial [Thermoplasmata archaeon]|nr:hypothetical protein [Thermoplasmata archaeon]